jgi:hypothetical protein
MALGRCGATVSYWLDALTLITVLSTSGSEAVGEGEGSFGTRDRLNQGLK